MAREDTAEDGCSQIEVFGSAPPTAGESMLQPYRPHMAISEVNTPGALDVASNQGILQVVPNFDPIHFPVVQFLAINLNFVDL